MEGPAQEAGQELQAPCPHCPTQQWPLPSPSSPILPTSTQRRVSSDGTPAERGHAPPALPPRGRMRAGSSERHESPRSRGPGPQGPPPQVQRTQRGQHWAPLQGSKCLLGLSGRPMARWHGKENALLQPACTGTPGCQGHRPPRWREEHQCSAVREIKLLTPPPAP